MTRISAIHQKLIPALLDLITGPHMVTLNLQLQLSRRFSLCTLSLLSLWTNIVREFVAFGSPSSLEEGRETDRDTQKRACVYTRVRGVGGVLCLGAMMIAPGRQTRGARPFGKNAIILAPVRVCTCMHVCVCACVCVCVCVCVCARMYASADLPLQCLNLSQQLQFLSPEVRHVYDFKS